MNFNRFKSIIAIATAAVLTLGACSNKAAKTQEGESEKTTDTKSLVCYFSATGTTANAAKRLAALANADLHEIIPAQAYTDADLDWRDSLSRSSVEMHNRHMRPTIADSIPNLKEYDIVYIGYPNWWNTAPTIINTFIEANNLTGKVIAPFMTSGGSNITNSEKELQEAYPSLKWSKGLLMNSVSDDEITDWIASTQKQAAL